MGTAADLLGAATGGATDWIKKNTPTKYVYVLELPPDMSTWFAFQIKPHWLLPIGKETWLGIKVRCSLINNVGLGYNGPSYYGNHLFTTPPCLGDLDLSSRPLPEQQNWSY